QAFFAGLVGIDAADLMSFIDDNEATIAAAGVEQWSFTAPGAEHTLVRKDGFYEMEVAGVRLVDWVADVVGGEGLVDVHCDDCEPPQPAGSEGLSSVVPDTVDLPEASSTG